MSNTSLNVFRQKTSEEKTLVSALPVRKRNAVSTAIVTILATTAISAISTAALADPVSCATTIVGETGGCVLDNGSNLNVFSSGVVGVTSGSAVYVDGDYSGKINNNGTIETVGNDNDYHTGIWIDGALTSSGSIVNSGEINASGSSALSGYGIYISDQLDGTISNSGDINVNVTNENHSLTAVGVYVSGDANGSITNSGDISVYAEGQYDDDNDAPVYAYGIYVGGDGNGTITNSGNIDITAYNFDSKLTVAGVDVAGSLYGSIKNTGTINIDASNEYNSNSAEIHAYGIHVGGDVAEGASIVNSGDINITASDTNSRIYAYGIYVSGDVDGSITNSGSITINANEVTSTAYAYGIYAGGDLNGTITNNGSITVNGSDTSDSSVYVYGVYVDGDVNEGASIVNSGSIDVNANNSTSWISAYGIDIRGDLNGIVTNSGSIEVNATNYNSGMDAYGIYVNSDVNGSIANSGTISVNANSEVNPANNVDINENISAYGIYAGGDINGSVSNSGSIDITANNSYSYTHVAAVTGFADISAYGIYAGGGVAEEGDITNSGSININATNSLFYTEDATGGGAHAYITAYGIYVSGDVDGNVTNSGTINVTATNNDWMSLYGIYANSDVNGSITNDGSITVTANQTGDSEVSAYGIYVDNDLNGKITNNGSINVTADLTFEEDSSWVRLAGIYVNGDVNDGGSIVNNGTITVAGEGTVSDGVSIYGIYVGTLADGASITNTGTIKATSSNDPDDAYSIYVNAGAGTVENSGTLVGNIYTGGTVDVTNDGVIELTANENNGAGGYINSNYTQSENASLAFDVYDNSNYGSLTVNDTATFAANTILRVNLVPGNDYDGSDLNDVVSADTLDATTFRVRDNSIKWNFVEEIDGDTIDLHATDTGLTSFAASVAATGGNGSGAARVVDSLLGDADTDPNLVNALADVVGDASSNQDASNKIAQLLPLLSGGADQAVFDVNHSVSRIIQERLGSESGVSTGDAFGKDRNAWVKPFGSIADQNERNGVAGYTANTYGVAVGADTMVNDVARVGVSFIYANSDVDGDGAANQTAKIDSYQGAVYGSYNVLENLDANMQVDVANNKNRGDRTVGASVASSKYDSWSSHVGAGLEQKYKVGGDMTFVPSVRADYASISNDSYAETGAGLLNLNVDSNTHEELILGVDGKVLKPINQLVSVTGNLGVGYDAIGDRSSMTSSFVGGGTTFTTKGIKPSLWLGRGGLGVVINNFEGAEITARYDVEGREDFTNQTASLKLRMPF